MFDTTNKSTTASIVKYNYLEAIIHPNYKKTLAKDKCIELPYLGNPSYPNLLLGNTLYNTTNFHLYGKLHHIKDLDYDGELVIEHSAITNWGGKVYLCIPLKTTTGIADTPIDNIISMTNQVSTISINQMLQQSANIRALVYNDTGFFTSGNTVIVLLKPISVRSHFQDVFVSKTELFATDVDTVKYDVIHMIQDSRMQKGSSTANTLYDTGYPGIETFVEGNADDTSCQKLPPPIDDSDVYISCKPSDVSTEDVQSFNMPLTSDMIKDNEHVKMMKNMMALFTVIFIFGMVSFFVPMIYQSMVISEILNYYLKQDMSPDEKKEHIYERITTMDIIISMIILSLSFGLIGDGVNTHSSVEKSFGMLIGGLYVLGWFMISNARLAPNYFKGILAKIEGYDVKTGNFDDVPSIENQGIFAFLRDIGNLLGQNITATLGFGFAIFTITWTTYYNSTHRTAAWFLMFYLPVFAIYFIYLIDQYYEYFDKTPKTDAA
jgi:hypothetical protein